MEMKCKFKTIVWSKVRVYAGGVTEASITEPGAIIRNFKGKHEAGKVDSSVEAFIAAKCTIKHFPIGVDSIFRNLMFLEIDSCGLVSLYRKDLNGLEDLGLISFRNNELTSLPSDLFVGFRKLKYIDFSDNKLEFVSSKLLEPVMQNELEFVNFRSNTKIDAVYDKGNEDGITLKQLMDTIDEKCKKPKGGPGFDLEHFDERFVESFRDIWKSKAFTDFTIVTKDSKEIAVHKNVLGIQSKIFAAAFNLDMEEKRTNRMVIDTFNSEAVEQFLGFFYTGRISNDVHAMELFALASQYEVSAMKMQCEEAVLRNLDEANAFEVFVLADLHSAAGMKDEAFNKMKDLMPDKCLNESLKDDPQKLKMVVDAARERAQSMQEADEKFKNFMKVIELCSSDASGR